MDLLTLGAGALPMASLSLKHSIRLSFSRTETLLGGASLSTTPLSMISMPATATATTPQAFPLVYCGRGDKKTAKGKRFKHSFGNARPRNKKKGRGPPRVPVPPAPPKIDKFDDGEIVKIEINESLFT